MNAKNHYLNHRGFTLLELLVVVTVIAILASLSVVGYGKFVENARKVQTLAQFRDFQIGMTLFEGDYHRPPIPQAKRDTGWDTIYGNDGGLYNTQFLVSALAGEDKDYPYDGGNFSTADVNPRNEAYITFPLAPNNKGGVGLDGKLYDPWGREIMVAINGLNAPNQDLEDFNNGQNDRRLHTWGLAEYTNTKPSDQSFVFWSYGADGKKGNDNEDSQAVVPLTGTDDVISW